MQGENLYDKKTKSLLFAAVICAVVFVCISTRCVGNNTDSDLSNTLVYAGEASSNINPILNTHTELVDLIFSGLMKYDGDFNSIVDLVESYTYDEANMVYTFHLRKGVTWHDGTPFTAEDVVFTYETLMNDATLSSTITSNYEDINSVTAPDDYTVVFVMDKYNAAMLSYFTRGIAPKHLLAGKDINIDSFNQHPVGTGRYKFVEWDTAGAMIILERNTAYYDKIPNIERIIYKTVSSTSIKTTLLTTGEADLAWLNANYAETFRGKAGYKNIDFITADYRGISMDYASDFWKNNGDSVGVLNYAIDKDTIVKSVLYGKGVAAYSPIQLSEYGGNTAADIYSYDLFKFAEEMEKLGWVKGSDGIYERNCEKFHFRIQVNGNEEERVDIANLCSQTLKAAGVDMEVCVQYNWDVTGYDGFLSGNACEFDPDMLYVGSVTGAFGNTMFYSNADVDKYLKKGRHAESETERKEAYRNFEVAYAENPGIVLVAYLDGNYVSIAGLDGLDTTRVLGHHAVGVMWNVEYWTLSK